MFDEVLRAAKELSRQPFSVKLDLDEDGYLDRQCPSKHCRFEFKVYGDDRAKAGADEPAFCPLCGHSASSESWNTSDQVQHALEQGRAQISAKLGKALETDARRFNHRQPRDGFLRMSLEVKGFKRESVIIPAPAKETLTLKITCEKCSFRFAVIGSAFFCPHCGHTSVERLFDDAARKVRSKIDAEQEIREAVEAALGRDEAELTCRSLVESCLSDCVGAVQSLAEAIYGRSGGKPARRNAFQNLEEGNGLWMAHFQRGYQAWLPPDELKELNLFFQQRHLLVHRQGLVDQDYLDRSGDRRFAVGQRVVIKSHDVRRAAELVVRLGLGLKGCVNADGPIQQRPAL